MSDTKEMAPEEQIPQDDIPESAAPEAACPETPEAAENTGDGTAPPGEEETAQAGSLQKELETLKEAAAVQEDKFLRLAAEYDNYRRRSQKEKDTAWASSKAETAAAFLPVYDNLERALKQETTDEAFKKGVEMTMGQLREVLGKLGISEIPALGETFDPNLHNAVMHVEDEAAGENTIVEVFQAGFRTEDKVIRFAMVKVAN